MTFYEKMEKLRIYTYAGNFFMLGGIMMLYGVFKVITQNERGIGFIIGHLTMASLGIFLTSIGVLIIRETRKKRHEKEQTG